MGTQSMMSIGQATFIFVLLTSTFKTSVGKPSQKWGVIEIPVPVPDGVPDVAGAAGVAVDGAGNAAGGAVDGAGNAAGSAVDGAGNAAGGAADGAGNAAG